jgi:hypothetical protein
MIPETVFSNILNFCTKNSAYTRFYTIAAV